VVNSTRKFADWITLQLFRDDNNAGRDGAALAMKAAQRDNFALVPAQLPQLHFEPRRDAGATAGDGLQQYLAFYGLGLEAEFPGLCRHSGIAVVGGFRIASHYWLPAACRGTVLVVHGYFDHVGLYGNLYRYLLSRGYAVVAFDLPGHGLSTGARAAIASFDHYVEVFDHILAAARFGLPGPVSAIGQSTGGAILLKRLLEQGCTDLERVVALAPLVHPAHWWANQMVYHLTHRYRKAIPRKFRINSGNQDFLHFLEHEDPLQDLSIPMDWLRSMKRWIDECRAAVPCPCPVVIVQGEADTTLAWRYNLRLLGKKFPAAEIQRIANAGHHLCNETPALREHIFRATGFDSDADSRATVPV